MRWSEPCRTGGRATRCSERPHGPASQNGRTHLAREVERSSDRECLSYPLFRGAVTNHHIHLIRLAAEHDLRSRTAEKHSKLGRVTVTNFFSGARPGFNLPPPDVADFYPTTTTTAPLRECDRRRSDTETAWP